MRRRSPCIFFLHVYVLCRCFCDFLAPPGVLARQWALTLRHRTRFYGLVACPEVPLCFFCYAYPVVECFFCRLIACSGALARQWAFTHQYTTLLRPRGLS